MGSSIVVLLLDVLVAPEEPLPAAGVLERHLAAGHCGRVALRAHVAARLGRPGHVQNHLVERAAADRAENGADPVDLEVREHTIRGQRYALRWNVHSDSRAINFDLLIMHIHSGCPRRRERERDRSYVPD